MDKSLNGHVKSGNAIIEWVRYEGSDILKEGEAVCYNTDYGTATDVDGRRCNHVERPSISNNRAFAGVAARSYPARSGGQFIEINVPGSRGVKVALCVDTVLDTGILSFIAGSGTEAGRFYSGKYRGRGSAIPRQTVTAVLKASMTGAISIATDGVTVTLAAHGASAGDTLCILGGEKETTTEYVVPGKYKISSISSVDIVVLSSSCVSDTPAAAVTATGLFYTGNPTCQADLLDGDESGGVEFISTVVDATGDQEHMAGGVSYLCGGVTLATAEFELAQGTFVGEKKAFICLGTIATGAYVVDLVTPGLEMDGDTAVNEVNAIDAAGDACYFEFKGALWHLDDLVGGATVA